MHGGSSGSGAPKGNKNAFVDGQFTREAIEEDRRVMQSVRDFENNIDRLERMFEELNGS